MKHICIYILLLISCQQLKAQTLDLRLLESINGPKSGADQAWRDVSASAYVTFTLVPISMVVTGWANHNNDLMVKGFETGSSIIIAEGFTIVLKDVVKRERPYLAYPNLIYGKEVSTDYSFPSGHASGAFALATSLSLSCPKWYVIAPSFAYAATVGYSRMYLGMHYPSDVLGGALVGAGSSYLTWQLQKLLNKKYHYNKNHE